MHKCDFCKMTRIVLLLNAVSVLLEIISGLSLRERKKMIRRLLRIFFLFTMGTTIQKRLQNTLLEITLV